mgnify:CR=1 FL=1
MITVDTLDLALRSDPGRLRPHNEDAVFGDASLGLAILADGMGGCNAGEVASSMATSLVAEGIVRAPEIREPHERDASGRPEAWRQLSDRIKEANAEIFFAAQTEPRYAGMGTTLVAAWFYDNHVLVAHLGDSRCYRLRDGVLECLTRDHSFLQEQLDNGIITSVAARRSNLRHLVTRALGVEAQVDPEIQEFSVMSGDLYLLCSDGLSDMVDDAVIESTLNGPHLSATDVAECLIRLANENGGRDNVSVVVISVRGEFPARTGWWRKLLPRFA